LEENFLRILQDRTAGDPMRQEVRWTDLTYEQIAEHLAEAGTPVSVPVVKQLLEKHGYVTRKAQKSKAMGGHADRNQQFENIARLKREFPDSDNPIVSMDTKKKELIGNFYRAGQLLTPGGIGPFDHDFPSFAEGVIIPHALYDVKRDDGHVNLGTSHDTGEFARDGIERWWEDQGRELYPRASSILPLCDGGGTSASHYLFKEDLQRLVDRLGIETRPTSTIQGDHHHPPDGLRGRTEGEATPSVSASSRPTPGRRPA
jgi:Rhodopirellula transposase DDE domain